ncbi:hypothetical protein E1295_20670 [Nonomuraea mesophila]|uniref:Uncharacterized protein n=1 Tax=Nonomuraea mesophila TaxID=2530382 RepID=A0A4R5FF18_9ACTN|nr:hypothetical protein [Nonomuraea mesophila]TDE49035.1 hypothetical protein E1295_20670 [Nonomuraea mesophila]
MPAEFPAARWERAYRKVVETAFMKVPFYRDQWVAAGRALDEPQPTPSEALADQLHRLCPFARPFDPSREPPPWISDGRDLREALAQARAPRRAPVLEVRPAVLDRRALGRTGPRYGVILAPGAKVVDEARRRELNSAALRLAARAGRATLVGERPALDTVLPELDGIAVTVAERMDTGQAVREHGLAYDPHLGYFAAPGSGCGTTHLLWRRFHARRTAGGAPAVTALRRARPVLVDVVPYGAETVTLGSCPAHGTPIIVTH